MQVLDTNRTYINLQPKCEPQLGRRGLYAQMGGEHIREQEHALLWVLNQSDGKSSLLNIARKSGLPFDVCRQAAQQLVGAKLLGLAPA